jgi:hypothetical protein
MPAPIVDACARARDFYRRPSLLPSLNKGLKKAPRERRSERREAYVLGLQELLMHTDVKTWRIGNYGGQAYAGRAVKTYARNMAVSPRRAERMLEDLTKRGYLRHTFDKKGRAVACVTDYAGRRYLGQKRIESDGNYEALAAEREWTAKGLEELAILAELKAARDATRKAARLAAEEKASLAASAARQRADDQQREFRRRARIRGAPKPAPLPEVDVKATHQLAYDIFTAAKETATPLTLAEAYTEARRRRGTGPPE